MFSIPAQGFLISQSPVQAHQTYTHYLGGPLDLECPNCPTCNKRLTRLLTLDTKDNRIEVDHNSVPMLPIVACTRCVGFISEYFYKLSNLSYIGLLDYELLDQPDPTTIFPPRTLRRIDVELQPLNPANQAAIKKFNNGIGSDFNLPPELHFQIDLGHQLGGEPILIQHNPEIVLNCALCGEQMPFLVSLGNNGNGIHQSGLFFYPYGQLLIFLCRNCLMVGGLMQVD